MDYEIAVGDSRRTVPGGTSLLLMHPSTGETDRIDTDFLKTDTDRFLVVSTRTTAREVRQKLEYYDVDESQADILDTLSVERGYSRRSSENVHYVSSPDDTDAIVSQVEEFLSTADGKRRLSFDSVTELAYYAGEAAAMDAVERMVALVAEYDAVALFHLSPEVHDDDDLEAYRAAFDGVIELTENGDVTVEMSED
jgi:KaiC/GvpD/RAD55 family RecA-like ATPase